MIKALKLNLRVLLIMLFMVASTLPERAESGFLFKRKKRPPRVNTKPIKRVNTKNPPMKSPPIKTPSKSSIVADSSPYKQCRATVLPSFINHSQYTNKTRNRSLKALSPPSIVVSSAGNFAPKPISDTAIEISKDVNAILVGSLSTGGTPSSFSQKGEEVHIMAPSGHFLTSATSTGHYRKYGGTSGAAPLVTGSLAGFEWIAGYHPTAAEAKILLLKTAIHMKGITKGHGVGMVNAYKLAMVAEKLKKACGKNISCFKDKIKQDDTYRFPEDEAVSEALDKAFPSCSSTCTEEDLKSTPSCAEKANALKEFRKQVFLNPQNKNLWKKLACVYAEGGFEENSRFSQSVYTDTVDRGSDGKDCKKDADCFLVPACFGNANGLIAKPRSFKDSHYILCMELNGKIPLCNGKCRCDSKEKVSSSSAEAGHVATASCVDSRCIITKEYGPPPPLPPGSGEIPPPESGGLPGSSEKSGAVK